MVHFDLDPSNVFIGLISEPASDGTPESGAGGQASSPSHIDPEHELVPSLKLGDFGLARLVDPTTTADCIESGKPGYQVPEQCPNFYQTSRRYGVHTNIWGFWMIMFNLVSLHVFLNIATDGNGPVEATVNGKSFHTYGNLINPRYDEGVKKDNPNHTVAGRPKFRWTHLSADLRNLIMECLSYNIDDRPSLEDLKMRVEVGIREADASPGGDADSAIKETIQSLLFDAPTSGSEDPFEDENPLTESEKERLYNWGPS